MSAKILVVDDEPDLELLIRQRYRKKIRDGTYEFSFALNGVEALERLDQIQGMDIVLTDINMPEMDGLTLLSRLKEASYLLKPVIVSAYGDMKNIRTAMNRGAFDFITKPIDFEDLEATLVKTSKAIKTLKAAARAREELNRLQQELNVASRVQQSFLPQNFSILPQDNPLEIYAEMIPAREVGGDFYDYFLLGDKQLGFVIGDVSGKGMPAALFMAVSRTLIKATALKRMSIQECLGQVNYLLCQDNTRGMFVTLFYGIWDFENGKLEYGNCGHNPPCVIRAGGQADFLGKSNNIALGVVENFEFQSQRLMLGAGDGIVLYTDGITEAMGENSVRFSPDRFRNHLQKTTDYSSEAIIESIINEVKRFTGGVPQSDDITTMVIKRKQ